MVKKRWKKMVLLAMVISFGTTMAGHAIYRTGDQGSEVKVIQEALKAKGFKTNVNGNFTLETKKAVLDFQRRYQLAQDGIVGPDTYKKLTGKTLVFKPSELSLQKGNKKALRLAGEENRPPEEILVVEALEPMAGNVTEASSATVKKLLDVAVQYRGVPYKFGGTTPKGFDCSGYLRYVFEKALSMDMPRMADEQYLVGKSISYSKLMPGDLVFFETYAKGVSHSGIYMGKGKFISATSSRGVIEADMTKGYWKDRYVGAKRVLK